MGTAKKRRKTAARRVEAPRVPAQAARAALDQATTAIRKLQRDVGRNFWAIGRRLVQIAELELHRVRGYSSIAAYAERALGIAPSTAFSYMRVAGAFSQEVAATYGVEKLDQALRYIAATPEQESAADVPDLRIRVPGEGGAPDAVKRFGEVTVAELRRSVRGASGGKPRKRSPAPPEEAAVALAKANRALDRALGRAAAGAADVTARVDGETTLLDVRGVPLDRAARAFGALAAAVR